MKTITVKCEICQKEFNRPLKEYNRNIKENTKFVCQNQNCRSTWGSICCARKDKHSGRGDIKLWANNALDEYSPFRIFIKRAKNYNKKNPKKELSLTLEDLKQLWEKQSGICPITNIKMILNPSTTLTFSSPKSASLDRIDSSKGYVKGNVQFVCYSINLAKNGFTDKQMEDFLGEIKVGGPGQHSS